MLRLFLNIIIYKAYTYPIMDFKIFKKCYSDNMDILNK